ncbi:MAG: murein biosynthesis integral membrane protein MurJ [Gemmatimonadaceae bacterium]
MRNCVGSPLESRANRVTDAGGEASRPEPSPAKGTAPPSPARGARPALLVGAGILVSRIFGLVRSRALAFYLGSTDAADAYNAALRIPNVVQNLFGEGALSAAFIPVYAGLLAEGEREAADRMAGVIGTLLALVAAAIVLAGVLGTPLMIAVIAPGFSGEKRELTSRLVRIFFPGIGLLVMSAWCLGILNSHRRFLLSYSAPIVWNVAIIAALVMQGRQADLSKLAIAAAWGAVVGSALQFAVQLPTVARVAPGVRLSLRTATGGVRTVTRNFIPALVSRGAVQISAWVDTIIASLLPTGATAALGYAQVIYTLPVSLFGMAVSAAELPAMASVRGAEAEVAAALRSRLGGALRHVAYFIVPSAVAFLALGDVVAALLYQTGRFGRGESEYVWAILAGSAVGLLASTMGRLYSSAFYALRDTRTPLRFALARIALTIVLGYVFALPLPRMLGIEPRWGAVGLTASAGIAGWLEFVLLRASLRGRIGAVPLPSAYLLSLWAVALLAAGGGWAVKLLVGTRSPALTGLTVLPAYGGIYLLSTLALRIPEATGLVARVARRR